MATGGAGGRPRHRSPPTSRALAPAAQVLQPLRLVTAVMPIGFLRLVVHRVQHPLGRAAATSIITARPAGPPTNQLLSDR